MVRTAGDLHAEGVRLANESRYAEARRALQRAAEATDDVNLGARITGTLAYVDARTGLLADAERRCRAALEQPGLDRRTEALLAGQLGAIAEQAGRLDDAERWLSRALGSLHHDSVEAANLLMNRCLVNIHRRRVPQAIADASEAGRIYAVCELPLDEAMAWQNQGYAALVGGDLITAMRLMNDAQKRLGAVSAVTAAIGAVDLAEVLRDAGQTSEAERTLASMAAVFGKHRMPQVRAEAEFQLALSLLVHDPLRARRVAVAAARRFREVGSEAWAVRADSVRLRAELSEGRVVRGGVVVPRLRRVPGAPTVAETASALERHGFASEATVLRLSEKLWRARIGDEVGASGRIAGVPASAPLELKLLAHELRAVRASRRGDLARARRHAAGGLDTLEEWRSDFGSIDLQTSATMYSVGLLVAGLDAATRSRRVDAVFDWSERARHLNAQMVPLRPAPDPQLAADLAELRVIRAGNADWQSTPRARELQARVRAHQWTGTGRADLHARASLDEFRSHLDEDTALLSYVFSGRALDVLVVTARRVALVPVPDWGTIRDMLPALRADLDVAAAIRGRMGELVRRGLDDRLAQLSRCLVDPAIATARTERFVITVPGAMGGMPWSMMPGLRGKPFTLALSASRWVRQHRDDRALGSAAFATGPGVRRAGEEVDRGATEWSGARTVTDASVDDVSALASTADVLHIAAHGRHAADNPMFSGLEMADGTLFGYDIDRIESLPDTVILSACEAGRSAVRWGEEAIGMTRTWLHAGTRSVIAAPVVVADDDACELLGSVHSALRRGLPPSAALVDAAARTGVVAPFQVHGAGL